jgi:predicted DNA-binding protein (MmcQ/YjbR family)
VTLFHTDGFDAFIETLPASTLHDQWDARVAKVGGKVFAVLSQRYDGASISLKCSEVSFVMLTEIEGIEQAPYFAKGKWVAITSTADFSNDDLRAYVTRSHELVAAGLTRRARQELGIDHG